MRRALIALAPLALMANQYNPIPAGASDADRIEMVTWFDLNEQCQGSSNTAVIRATCPARTRLELVLRSRGWCWSWADWQIMSSQNRWHSCRYARP